MWSGRFEQPLDPAFESWQRSFSFDWRLLPQEIAASKAHAGTLHAAGLLTAQELAALRAALESIAREHWEDSSKRAHLPSYTAAEDVHHFVELELVLRVGDLGLKLHTGRSRNEQIATDLRLYVRAHSESIREQLEGWAAALVQQARAAGTAAMPAYTHLQRAEPVLVAHWLLAYVEMFARDLSRLQDLEHRLNYCPLGSGAVAGATLRLDRELAAQELGFTAPTANSMDATSDRDFVVEFLQVLGVVALHASRFAEEITVFATAEFGFVTLPEAFSTGSSAMPQKKNPDLTELVRGRTARILAASQAAAVQLKGLPLAYNKDLQEMQHPLFDAVEAIEPMLALLPRFTLALAFRTDRMEAACHSGYLNAMAAATYLSHRGVPFRRAHHIVGQAVRYALDKGCELGDLSLEELRQFAPEFASKFAPDFFDAITLESTLNCHDVAGGTAIERVQAALSLAEDRFPTPVAAPAHKHQHKHMEVADAHP
jgi:argininosuccinate lyase